MDRDFVEVRDLGSKRIRPTRMSTPSRYVVFLCRLSLKENSFTLIRFSPIVKNLETYMVNIHKVLKGNTKILCDSA